MKASQRQHMWQLISTWCNDFWHLIFEYCTIQELYRLLQLNNSTNQLVKQFPRYLISQIEYFITHSERLTYRNLSPPIRIYQMPCLSILEQYYATVNKPYFWHSEDYSLNELLLHMNQFDLKQVESWKESLYFWMNRISYNPFFIKCFSKVPFLVEEANKACTICHLSQLSRSLQISYFNSLLEECHFVPSTQLIDRIPCNTFGVDKEEQSHQKVILWDLLTTNNSTINSKRAHFKRLQPFSDQLWNQVFEIKGGAFLKQYFTEFLSKEFLWKLVERDDSFLEDSQLTQVLLQEEKEKLMRFALQSPYGDALVPVEYWSANLERMILKLTHCTVKYATLHPVFKEEWKSNIKLMQFALLSDESNISLVREEDWQKEEYVVALLSNDKLQLDTLKLPEHIKTKSLWMEKIVYSNSSAWEFCSTKFKSNLLHAIHVMQQNPNLFDKLDSKLQKKDEIRKLVIDAKLEHLFIHDPKERQEILKRRNNEKQMMRSRTTNCTLWRVENVPSKLSKKDSKPYLLNHVMPFGMFNRNVRNYFIKYGLDKDEEFMKQCIRVNHFAFYLVDDSLRKDFEFLKFIRDECDTVVFEHISWNDLTDVCFIMELYLLSSDKISIFV